MAAVTKDNLAQFKAAYEKAVSENKEIFVFEGQDVLVSYAKYVVEYVKTLKK